MNDQRPTWPEVWMELAENLSRRSCDIKTQVGAVIVSGDNTRVLSLGYNGTPHGFPNERESLEEGKAGTIHAEQNALYKLSYNEQCEKIIYTTFSPCPECARGLIQCRINRVVYKTLFRDTQGIEIIKRGNIEVYTLDEAISLTKERVWESTREVRLEHIRAIRNIQEKLNRAKSLSPKDFLLL
jgi:deoxycytidylate deaminase